jgi:hypothetical protein
VTRAAFALALAVALTLLAGRAKILLSIPLTYPLTSSNF